MEDQTHSFGYWLRRRRKSLDLTQEALAQRVCCSGFTIRKIEADERRPSRRLAERLAASLAIPEMERRDFLDAARALHATSHLQLDRAPVGTGARAAAPAAPILPLPDSAIGAASDTTPFVGRSNEYGLLIGLIARLTAGAGYTVLIEGEPGIGKSRLLREVTRYAHAQDLPTLATNCYEIERAMPYQPVIGLVTRALDRVSDAALRAMSPVSLAELAALVPEVGERIPDLPQLSKDFPEARQARLSRAVDQLLEASRGGRPAVFMVDDIQWADDASAQVLHYLARHAAQRAVLVIYAYRDEAVDSDERFAQLVEGLRRDTDARRVPLARLDYADTESLVAALADANLGIPGLAERLHRETEGNPFFLMSILQSLSDGETQLESASSAPGLLPDALRAAVRVRLAHVPKAIRPLLETAAVLGRRFDFDTLLDVTREPETPLLDAVEAFVKRRLLREEPEGGVYDFSHDKLREVLYRDIGGARRRLLHQSVAEALERRGEDATHERDAELAEHYERAHVWSKALHYLVLAGEHSQTLFAMRDALHWLDRAVALFEAHPESLDARQRLAIYEQRGAARAQAGQTQGAVADMRRVIDVLRAGGERAKTRDALIQLGMAYRRADQYEAATACLTEALTESRAMNDERHAADTLYHLGTVAWSTGQNDQAIGFHQQAVDICERTGFTDLVAVQAYHGRGEAHFANAEPAAAIACYTRSLALARGIGDKSYESENLMMIGHACIGTRGLGDYPRATASFEAALDIARSADLQWHFGPTLLGLDHARACTGRYGEAWTGMQKTLHWLESLSQVRYQLIACDCIGHLLLDLGLNELAIEHLERGLTLGRDTGILFWRAAIDTHLAVARSRLGKKLSTRALQTTLEQTCRTSERYMTVRCLDGLAEIALTAGDASRCRVYGDELLAIAEPNGLRELEAVARRWRGEAMLMEEEYREAQAELSRAAALAQDIGRVRLQMDVQAALARLLAAQGQRDAAQCHDAKMHAIAKGIEKSLEYSGLEARLRMN
ncbi:adenylate cyclase [Sulfuriferula multivorans]|uniref:Adenylate cyclase n=1 Tax=Sulfuriferula multivorans TaxID=1559896 RepID=A0A401JB18_9PROT|nr:AAA family ATPase [Sulfuriferula multivorans]GBL44807.1 adenylate cyclase [Sulfuriferula multivorans]